MWKISVAFRVKLVQEGCSADKLDKLDKVIDRLGLISEAICPFLNEPDMMCKRCMTIGKRVGASPISLTTGGR
jgi:hypothetical protein